MPGDKAVDEGFGVVAVSCGLPLMVGVCAQCGAAAPKGRRCCSSVCARRWADEHVWGSAKVVALARSGYACEQCGALDYDAVLDVHHVVPVAPVIGYRPGCQHHQSNLVVLCRLHHLAEHAALRAKPGEQLMLPVRAA